MELPIFIAQSARAGTEIKTIEMHTTGEPTRIVYSGYPYLSGTLLEQRAQAQSCHDHIRRSIICEPRGHREMYGAVLRPSTELVRSGQAHIGVLFLTNDGYSTMCGHATLAVARLLVDHLGSGSKTIPVFDGLELGPMDDQREVQVNLHVPCGLVHVTVPVVEAGEGAFRADVARPISYLSVPSYATGISATIPIPKDLRWPELGERDHIVADIAYGGAFYIIASPSDLGFDSSLSRPDLTGLGIATRKLKAAFNKSEHLRREYLYHPEHSDLQFLYGTLVTDASLGDPAPGTAGAETTLCFFSDAQVDRSPTGSGVQAKVALAVAKRVRKLNERWRYKSILSNHFSGQGAFVGEAVETTAFGMKEAVIVKVSGWARYTGTSTFMVENGDEIGEGFMFDALGIVR